MTNDTVLFQVHKDATKSFETRKNKNEDILEYSFFTLFKDTLTKPNFSIGVDEKIFRNQDENGAIALPKAGIYLFELQMDCKNTYTSDQAKEQFKLFLKTGLEFFVNGQVVNDKPDFNYEITDKLSTTLPTIKYRFKIFADNDTFAVNFAPIIKCKNKSIDLPFELFSSKFELSDIIITIKKEANVSITKKNS